VNFEPKSSIFQMRIRDYPLADPTLVNPLNAVALVDGEWLTLNADKKLVRAADITVLGSANVAGRASVRSFPVWGERGRTDWQASSSKKVPIIESTDWEADTRLFDATAVCGNGLAITTPLQPLKVATILIGSRNVVGLVGHGGSADTDPIVGYVKRLPAKNGGKLRISSGMRS
jgi:hypothetical protein